jgi:hypothetical protein
MPDPISGMAVASIGGSLISAGAAGKAANTQADATERAAQLQNEQFLRSIELQEPFRQGGLQGQNKLLTYLGLGGTPQYDDTAYNRALADYNASLSRLDPSQFMSGGGGGGYYTSGGGESDQIPIYQEGTGGTFDQAGYDKARAGIVAPNREQFKLTGGDVNDPMFGKYATAEFGGIKGFDPASLMKGFTAQDFQADPGYAFRMSEGMKALESSAAARGGLLSGSTLKGTQRFGQDLASQEYQNAFNRFQANRASQGQEYGNAFNRFQAERAGTLNPLQSLAGVGQSTANTIGNMGMNYANQVGELYQGGANARASGYVGGANALNQGISGVSNMYFQNQLLNRLPVSSGSTAGGWTSA